MIQKGANMNEILEEAITQQANDIYILPIDNAKYVIKFHVDGQSYAFKDISEEEAQLMVSAIKYRAKMNISERRRPQLGRFQFDNIWIRVSTVGDFLNRETVVLRMIYQQQKKTAMVRFSAISTNRGRFAKFRFVCDFWTNRIRENNHFISIVR